ncbi:MAG: family glycosyltransferase, 4-amino-4-deoxy-L-arabinose transferase, partial [Candidatus Paceibacter sp.]|nr:family glycosyltransferase, 4-amino-4-deoxy-L-arabinose transferase [Candidatus Paceibacter sp.]
MHRRFENIALSIFSIVYFVYCCINASYRYLWYDELSTFHLAFSPHWLGIFTGLLHEADVTPPFYFILTKIAGFFVGHTELAVRLPSIIGFWIFLIVIYKYLAHKAGPIMGLLGLLIGLLNIEYAFEGRPYGLVLGLSAIAYAAWATAIHGKHERLMRWLVFGSMFLAFLSHYYACVLFIPLFCAELWRVLRNRGTSKKLL